MVTVNIVGKLANLQDQAKAYRLFEQKLTVNLLLILLTIFQTAGGATANENRRHFLYTHRL
jgi:hypothetical protein